MVTHSKPKHTFVPINGSANQNSSAHQTSSANMTSSRNRNNSSSSSDWVPSYPLTATVSEHVSEIVARIKTIEASSIAAMDYLHTASHSQEAWKKQQAEVQLKLKRDLEKIRDDNDSTQSTLRSIQETLLLLKDKVDQIPSATPHPRLREWTCLAVTRFDGAKPVASYVVVQKKTSAKSHLGLFMVYNNWAELIQHEQCLQHRAAASKFADLEREAYRQAERWRGTETKEYHISPVDTPPDYSTNLECFCQTRVIHNRELRPDPLRCRTQKVAWEVLTAIQSATMHSGFSSIHKVPITTTDININ
ncbi:unnamed protein product [Caenorhabditis brenneri]